MRQCPTGKHGGKRKGPDIKSDIVRLEKSVSKEGTNSRAYIEQRLQRNFPEIWQAKERQARKPAGSVPVNCPGQKAGDARDKAGESVGVSRIKRQRSG